MKYKSGNIITSDDVTMLGSNSGKTLQKVVEDLQKDNNSLKSNVKWIYKYGGVGGSGGGSYSSSSWSAVINIGGFSVDDKETKTVTFDTSGYRKLYIHINNPNKDSFIVSYTYNEGISKKRVILNQDNLWTQEEDILLNVNSLLSISITDGNNFERQYNVRYITNAYQFTPYLVNDSGFEYDYELVEGVKRYNIFIDDIKERGLNYVLKYDSFINKYITYEYTKINSTIKEQGSKTIIDGEYQENLFMVQAINDIENINEDFASNYIFDSYIIIDGIRTDFSLVVDLLPNSLYLKVQPKDSDVVIYPDNDIQEYRKYLIGNKSFILTAYNGKNPDYGDIICECYINDEKYGDVIYLSPSKSVERVFVFNNDGWNTLKFIISKSGREKQFIYYIYTEFPEDTIDWFDENLNLDQEFNAYYRYSIGTKGLTIDGNTINYSQYINKNVNQDITRINWNKDFVVKHNLIVNVGIQYNYINSTEGKIIKILGSDEDENSNLGIDIYQNKLTVNNQDIGGNMFYLEKQDDYNQSDNLKYHLITITFKHLRSSGLNNKYEIDVYIDGILQNSTSEHVSGVLKLNKILLYNKNYSINLLDIAYLDNNISDVDIVRYKWAYQNQIQQSLTEIANKNTLLSLFNEIKLEETDSLLNGHVYFDTESSIRNLVESVNVPILCLEYNYEANGQKSFFEWSDHRYEADSHNSQIITVGLQWASKNETSLHSINTNSILFDSSQSIDVEFILDIQGSTTRTYKSKNYELGVRVKNDPTNGIAVPIFTPNFRMDDKNSFLPETSFTLKADVVDSSHTNNTCVGKFVNEVTEQFEDAQQITSRYSRHIKNCLQGFPILLFVHSNEDTSKYYYLGIYNFNLGRSSYFNLGYCDLNLLPELEDSGAFKIYTAHGTSNKLPLISNFVVAEIDKNESWFDFSQSDSTMLFALDDADDQFMFDEIVPDVQNSKDIIQRFVDRAAKAGYFTFNKLEKGFHEDIHHNYTNRKGYVPNAERQYRREWNGSSYQPVYKGNLSVDLSNGKDLLDFIYSHDDNIPPYCNYNSLVEYYTICMALGLLDSVQKNLNIKSWNNGNTFYLAFYDMDTCLGINNNGDPVSYFAFSDYWESNEIENNNEVLLSSVSVSRDYSPGGSDMYDIPSSYIFAIAKYAKTLINTYKLLGSESDIDLELLLTPQNLWATWRKQDGALKNANYFIDTFYNGYMEGVNELMFNYNFRAKYFVETSENGYNSDELGRFHGRNVGYVRNWINSRLHILDAYFNLNALMNIPINDGGRYNDLVLLQHDPNYSIVYETYPINNMSLSNDVYITKSIFGDSMSFSGNIELIISAPDYSPLVISGQKGSLNRYLFRDSQKRYKLNISNTGTNKLIFGGSYIWTYLDSINSIANGTVQITSNKLTNLNGTSGNASQWGLDMPALQEVNLTSPNYSGALIFDASSSDSFPNLNSINISGSQINLSVINEKLSTINVSNIVSNQLTIQGCSMLTNVYMNSIRVSECKLQPISWIPQNGTMTLQNTNITKLQIQADKNQSLVINNDKSLSILDATGFYNVTISNCPKLNTIILSGNNLNSIQVTNSQNVEKVELNCNNCTNITLNNCIKLTTLKLTGNNYSSIERLDIKGSKLTNITYDSNNNLSMLDLSRLVNLNYFDIGDNNQVEYIKFSNDFNKPILIQKSFRGCNNLRRIYGHISISNTSETFYKLTNFSILGGSSVSKWKGFDKTVNGVYQLPIKLIGGVVSGDNHNEILEKLNTVTLESMFDDTSENVTNVRFHNSISGSFDSFLYGTNIDQFDIYYIFNVFGLSNVGNTTSVTNYSFYGQTDMFSHSDGNSFDRYMFYKCSKITSFSGSNYNFRTGATVLFSPSFNSSTGEVIVDNGLFSPLTGLTRLQRFSSGSTYFSRYLLRRKEGNYSNLQNITYCNTFTLERDDIDSISNLTGLTQRSNIISNINKVGNMTDFFKNTPNIQNISNSFNMTVLNYDTLQFPNTIASIHNAFRCTYGTGEFNWGKVFDSTKTYSALTTLAYAFNISDVLQDKVNFELYNEMFYNMPNLIDIGYKYYSDAQGGFTTNQSGNVTFSISFGFSGAGFNKTLRNNTFPYNIISRLTKLVNFVGFFSGLVNNNCSIDFPGNMFINNTKLANIAGLFQNCKLQSINLTSKGFRNCRQLENVTNLFYNSVSSGDNDSTGSLVNTMIPYQFFFTGYDTDIVKTYIGTNSQEIKEQDEEYSISGEGTQPELSTQSVTIKVPNRSITYATQCFYGQHKLKSYSWDSDFNWESLISTNEINNSNYIPFKYYKEGNEWYERDDNDLRCTSQYDLSNIYDGNPEHIVSNVYCKDMQRVTSVNIGTSRKKNSLNYFCSPDLFCSFKDNGAESVQAMFKYCGRGTTSVPGYRVHTIEHDYKNDFEGRICPYLFDNISSVINLTSFFECFTGLSSYKYNDITYLIPPTLFENLKNLTLLCKTFAGIYYDHEPNFTAIQRLSSEIDIRGLFSMIKYDGAYSIARVFNGLTLSNISGCFCCREVNLSTDVSVPARCTVNTSEGSISTQTNSCEFNDVFSSAKNASTLNNNITFYTYHRCRGTIIESNTHVNEIMGNNSNK